MFTGLVTDIGKVIAVESCRIRIACGYPAAGIAPGASIACDGCCLTATDIVPRDAGAEFTVDISAETLARTTLGGWRPGTRVNLERSLVLGAELGGHLVAGHVDGVAQIVAIDPIGNSIAYRMAAPPQLARFIAEKGSVTLAGTSLTVNAVNGAEFTVTIIPHTAAVTTWGAMVAGDRVNLEVDLIARYVERLISTRTEGLL